MMDLFKAPAIRVSMTLTFFIALLAGFSASADELLMKDGSRLMGKVLKKDDRATIDFKTSFAGVITIDWSEVDKLITENPMTVLLKNGETREVKKAINAETGIIIINQSGTSETIHATELGYVNPKPWRLEEGWSWSGNTNVALHYERGNSEKDEYELEIHSTLRRINDRLNIYGDFDREKKNDVLTDDDWRSHGRYDHFITRKLYYGANLGLAHDRFADTRLRIVVGPTMGYEFYEGKTMNLDVAAGPMYVTEDFYDEDDRDFAAFGWEFDFDRFLIPDRVQFYHRHRGLLEAADTDNLVWDAWTGFRFPIYAGIIVSTELKIEYDGGATKGVENTETTYNVKLGYRW